ncbi:MAG: hypothetical protein LBI99_00890 [Propionibacteriaceae bacterium]|nr:hypothetical protein [Propionibacteriaceae bacterium]
MGVLRDYCDLGHMAYCDSVLRSVGAPAFFVPTITKYDCDLESLLAIAESYSQLAEQISTAAEPLDEPMGGDDCWEGQGRDQADDYRECVRAWWQEVLDFLLAIIEWLVQIIDYILDLIWIILSWIDYILMWVDLILWVAALAVGAETVLMGTVAIGAVATAVAAIAAICLILGALLRLIDLLIEWLQDLIRSGRSSICGDGIIPSPPEWDPGNNLPDFPF